MSNLNALKQTTVRADPTRVFRINHRLRLECQFHVRRTSVRLALEQEK